MFVKVVKTDIPSLEKPVGFDLKKGDWVMPYGTGLHSDFVFRISDKHFKSIWNCHAQMDFSFSNTNDVIAEIKTNRNVGSKLALPKQANFTFCTNGITRVIGCKDMNEGAYGVHLPEDMNYVFRVRTKLDENGDVESALYGKIHGNIKFGGLQRKTAGVQFNYYLNPAGTNNLEFDPKRNLFKGDCRVYAP